MMTKKIFKQFADATAVINNAEEREQFIFRCIRIFSNDNPRFSETKYREYIENKIKSLN